MTEKIIILDFGSQYTQLIARNLRELEIYCEIQPFHKSIEDHDSIKGIILSGSPFSCNDENSPIINIEKLLTKYPVLGICFGAQVTAKNFGGTVAKTNKREFGRATYIKESNDCLLTQGIPKESQVWMSHGDSILELPKDAVLTGTTKDIPVASYSILTRENPFYGIQFHPEVTHSLEGKTMISNFVKIICGCECKWTPSSFVAQSIADIKQQVGDQKVLMALSGGVDSTVAAGLIHRAIGTNLVCVFVDNGLLRKNEFESVLKSYQDFGLNIIGVNAKEKFYEKLKDITDPEQKRKIIGGLFIDIFDEEAKKLENISFLGQGTIYPDVIESVSVAGPSATIKSHHNVGGLPETMKLKLVEPLRFLFKDEVRKVGRELGITEEIVGRHPFPGPGFGIRILGEVTEEKVNLLQEADAIFINKLKSENLYNQVWQAGTILLPVQSVGVMGDERTYEFTVALRAVSSTDGMTADWVHLPYSFLSDVSNDIINSVKGINRVVYDISSKPPATIEWE